jgi:hypothetical protein
MVGCAGASDRGCEREANQQTYQGMRTRIRNSQPPGADVPEQGTGENRDEHACGQAAVGWRQDRWRNDFDERVSHGDAPGNDANEIHDSGQNHCNMRTQDVGVDHGCDGVRGVVKSVGEFKDQDQHETARQYRDYRWRALRQRVKHWSRPSGPPKRLPTRNFQVPICRMAGGFRLFVLSMKKAVGEICLRDLGSRLRASGMPSALGSCTR